MPSEIVPDRLYVGDAVDGEHSHEDNFDRVVSVGGGCYEGTTHCLQMQDDYGVDTSTFNRAADAVARGLQKGEKVLVHCAVGASRSPAVAAAAMASLDDTTFQEAIDEIAEGRGSMRSGNLVHPHPALESAAKDYIESRQA